MNVVCCLPGTPLRSAELIGFYKSLLGVKTDELDKQISRLEKGVATLQKTQTDVNQLKQVSRRSRCVRDFTFHSVLVSEIPRDHVSPFFMHLPLF